MKNKYATVSSSSRFNYGDVLYPFLFNYIETGDITNINLRGKDLFGSKNNTISYLKAKNKKFSKIFYLGGEIFPKSLIKHSRSESLILYLLFRIKDAFRDRKKNFELDCDEIYSLGIGLQNLNKTHIEVIEYLKKFKSLYVRDCRSLAICDELGINAKFSPDLVFSISNLIPAVNRKKYCVFHFNADTLKNNYSKSLEIINYYRSKSRSKPIIINLATCKNHDSIRLLKKIGAEADVEFMKMKDIFKINNILQNTDLYVGNSFHGGVVTLSYGGRCVWVEAHGNKLKNLAQTYKQSYIALGNDEFQQLPEPTVIDNEIINEASKSIIQYI